MEYSPPPFFKRGPSLLTRFAFFSLLSIAFLISDSRFNYLQFFRETIEVVVYPLQRISAMPGEALARVGGFFVTQSRLQKENDQLRHQQLVDGASLQTYRALEAENEHLRRLLKVHERWPREYIAAGILYANRDPFTRQVVLDKGSQHGVVQGQAVIDHAGVVGQVTRLFPWLAEVTLITDKEQAIPIQVVRSGLRGIAFGIGYEGSLELRFMPVNADIQNGDILATSGIDGVYPAGIPVAVVTNIERNAAYAFARIYCRPLAGVSSFKQVLIVSSNEPLPERPGAHEPEAPARKTGAAQ